MWKCVISSVSFIDSNTFIYRRKDSRSYLRNQTVTKKKKLKKIQARTGFEPMTSAMPV